MGILTWLRRQVRDAVLGGVADAVEVLQQTDDPEGLLLEHRPEVVELPAPEVETVRNGRKVKVQS
jgi:hypothetical protein